jgi:amino acid transporter
MYFTHEDFPRAFQVPFRPWLVPVLGILLCIVLLINITKGAAIRFGVWMAIGHIIYFSYGFWHSKGRLLKRQDSYASNIIIVPESLNTDVDYETIEVEVEDTHL